MGRGLAMGFGCKLQIPGGLCPKYSVIWGYDPG